MNENNIYFLKEYIRLDKLCKDMFEIDQNGITAYLEEMDENHSFSYIIRDWDDDYDQLKIYRHLRNRMCHDPDALIEEECTEDDVQWLKNFQKKIHQSTDPLARLQKHKRQIAERKKQEAKQIEQLKIDNESPRSIFQVIVDVISYFFDTFR